VNVISFDFYRAASFITLLSLLITLHSSSQPVDNDKITAGDIRLAMLQSADEILYYPVRETVVQKQISIALYGHIYQRQDPQPPYLSAPVLILEKRSLLFASEEPWQEVDRALSPAPGIEVARLQNIVLHPSFQYRIGVASLSPNGGRYALVLDPSVEGYEFEVEDLDFRSNPRGYPFTMSCAYVAQDPFSLNHARILIGTEEGYVLESTDDAKTWRILYPPPGGQPPYGPVFGIFQDSSGILYFSPWTTQQSVLSRNVHGQVLESRDGGHTWQTALRFQWPTGTAWRMTEDFQSNVFIGEYTSQWDGESASLFTGNIWRSNRKNRPGDSFELVYSNPNTNRDTPNNHVHYIGVDPFTGHIYATFGDGNVGRLVVSRENGDPGTWRTLETGVDSQYTAITFTPEYLFLGQDTNRAFKKVIRWEKGKEAIYGDEPFWTSTVMDYVPGAPVPWADKGNWFWGQFLDRRNVLLFQYLPYGMEPLSNGQMQPPRLYATNDFGDTWWRALTFPPVPISDVPIHGFYGPKSASNVGPDGWIYASYGTVQTSVHKGFRIRLLDSGPSCVQRSEQYR